MCSCGQRSYQRRIAASTSAIAAMGATARTKVQALRIRSDMIAISSQISSWRADELPSTYEQDEGESMRRRSGVRIGPLASAARRQLQSSALDPSRRHPSWGTTVLV